MPHLPPAQEWPVSLDRMPELLRRLKADREIIERRFPIKHSPRRREALHDFLSGCREELESLPFEDSSPSDRLDWILLKNLLTRDLHRLDREEQQFTEAENLLPFVSELLALEDARRDFTDVDSAAVAQQLDAANTTLTDLQKGFEEKLEAEESPGVSPMVANRAAGIIDSLLDTLKEWYGFYGDYDPVFTWWAQKPYETLRESLESYRDLLRKRVADAEDPDTIIGDPTGREALIAELEDEMMPYTPEELIAIARRELEWCQARMLEASNELGFGDDWRAALEKVKSEHVPPGEQPALIRDLAREAVEYVERHELVSVPPLARDCWRMKMMSPERQKKSPFFLGGETIVVSFPTSTMDHEHKLMSLRGNNRAFARATVQHELIPGHYLQAFTQGRYRPYRRMFYTPFWTEGWALHWEMLLWDHGFPQSAEDRVGMLFWRMHRCARVVFSFGFHLGEMTPQECVDMLVDDIGHERENAMAEVRRSFEGGYGALYQCAYLIGGLQVRALHQELVGSGRMSNRDFHDAILRENSMPWAAVRASLLDLPLERDFTGDRRFIDVPT